MLIYDVMVGLAFAGVIWLALEHPPQERSWRETHRRVRRKSRDEGA